ncbi:MAG TPA: hypothetical protein VG742_12190 [Dongiaceae bacterium]|nr:hypothetical protein [Dongiaceae bacterium]
MIPTAASKRDSSGEAGLWLQHLAVLRQALLMRKPDAQQRIRRETAKLEREVEAMSARRKLAVRAARDADCPAGVPAIFAELDDRIAERLRQISDLAVLLHGAARGKAREEGGTAEAASRPATVDPIIMLQGKGKLTEDQVRAAREIAWVHQAITRAGRARVSRLSQIDPPAGWQEIPLPERAALIHAKRFRPWAEGLRKTAPATLEIVLRVAVLGISVYSVARARRMSWNGCVARLANGLDLYWRGTRGG